MTKTLIVGGNIVRRDGCERSDILLDETGRIECIQASIATTNEVSKIDATGCYLFPLLTDCHVHFREPGLEHKATMMSEARSALAGGVGTVCEMPNTIPPTVTIAALADKVRRASSVDGVRLFFFFGITEEAHLQTFRELMSSTSEELERLRKHCCGVKLYLDHSTGNQKVDGGIVPEIFKACAEFGVPLVAHCEDAEMNAAAREAILKNTDIKTLPIDQHSAMRPNASEARSIGDAIAFAEQFGTHLHIAHLSTKEGVELVRAAKERRVTVAAETAPHHLFLTIDDYTTIGTLGKMNPPLRSMADRDALWQGVIDGTIDCISTDHAPHTLDEKQALPALNAPSGVPGVETMLPLLLTVALGSWPHPTSMKPAGIDDFSLSTIYRACFEAPQTIFRLGDDRIEVKKTPRLMMIDPTITRTLRASELHAKCGWTPFEGWKVRGRVR